MNSIRERLTRITSSAYITGLLVAVWSKFMESSAFKAFMRGLEVFEILSIYSLLFEKEQLWNVLRSLDCRGYLGLICVLVCNHVFPVPTHVFIFGYQIWKLARSLELYRTLFYENLAQFEMVKLQQV